MYLKQMTPMPRFDPFSRERYNGPPQENKPNANATFEAINGVLANYRYRCNDDESELVGLPIARLL